MISKTILGTIELPFCLSALLCLSLCWILVIPDNLQAQEHLLFKPLLANPLEARIGTQVELPQKKLRLDIGHSFDLIQVDSSSSMIWMAGGDFMTYTRLRSEGRLKFPVETVDYYFGINNSLRWLEGDHQWSLRVRLAHISAHLADGLADSSAVLHPKPYVYSREFIDAVGTREWSHYRVYAGFTAVFSNHNTEPRINLIIPQVGAEARYPLNKTLSTFAAYDLKLSGISGNNSLVHAAQVGFSIPQRNGYELLISAYYYHGLSLHGLFYATVDDYWGLGFQVGL